MVTQAELEAAICAKVGQVDTLLVSDVSGGCGQAYDVMIVSDVFEGLPTLKRHRLVNDRLKDEIAQMHAFSQKTYTRAQFESLRTKHTGASPAVPSVVGAAAGAAAAGAVAADPAAAAGASADPRDPTGERVPSALQTPGRSSTAHKRTSSSVSVPELTLTPDTDSAALRQQAAAGQASGAAAQAHGSAPSSGTQSPVHVPAARSTYVNYNTSISRLHRSRVSSVEFWQGLRGFLESQFLGQSVSDQESPSPNGSASPASSRQRLRPQGEAEVERLFEDFFLSQKHHLSANDVAMIRDATGMFGMAGT